MLTKIVASSKFSSYLMLSMRRILPSLTCESGLTPKNDISILEFGVLDYYHLSFVLIFGHLN